MLIKDMSDEKYWFGFKQTSPKPSGKTIVCGPYSSYDKAKKERH